MTQTKVCARCRAKQELSCFALRKSAKDGRSSWCRTCYREHDKTRYASDPEYFSNKNQRWALENRARRTQGNAEWRKNHPEASMIIRCRKRAKARGLDFTITVDDISIPETCPILGIPLFSNWGVKGSTDNSPSLDRVDNALGYVPGNVQVISNKANLMKNSATVEELQAFSRWVDKTYGT